VCCPVGPVRPQPDKGIEHLLALEEDVDHLIAHLAAHPAEPVVPGLSEIIEPGEGEVAEVSQDQALLRLMGRHLDESLESQDHADSSF
jgi:hypothetical protein